MEQTFIMIKPDFIHVADDILKELDQHGTRIKTSKIDALPHNIVKKHYSVHKEKPHYQLLLNEFINKSAVIAIYEGENIVQKFIDLIGSTDPSKAPKHTIRARYSNDSKEKANAENRTIKTVIHRSDSPQEAQREIQVWKQFFD